MRYKRSSNITPPSYIFHAVVFLLCAVLISSGAVAGNWARYRSQNEGGDSARVITFGELSVKADESNNTLLVPGLDSTYQAYVSFEGSEAQTYVFVRLALDGGWTYDSDSGALTALGGSISMKIAEDWSVLSFASGEAVLYRTQEPLAPLADVPLIANGGKISVSSRVSAYKLAEFNSKISVKAYAVQANGFEDVNAAWSSVSGKGGGA